MRVKERWRIDAYHRSCKAYGGPVMHIHFPLAMADRSRYPGADSWTLASVYALDGKAVVRPSTLRCGILVVDWYKLMRFIRRHRLA